MMNEFNPGQIAKHFEGNVLRGAYKKLALNMNY